MASNCIGGFGLKKISLGQELFYCYVNFLVLHGIYVYGIVIIILLVWLLFSTCTCVLYLHYIL